MPRPESGGREQLLGADGSAEGCCDFKAKALQSKRAAGVLAIVLVAGAAVAIFLSTGSSGKSSVEPEVPETPDDPDHGLERFHCVGPDGKQICNKTMLTGGATFETSDCNNSCTTAQSLTPGWATASRLEDFPCMGGTCSGTGICCADVKGGGPCCPDPKGVCCPAGCCPEGHSCCQENHCCPHGTTCCPEGGCCPAGTTCAGGNKCKRMDDEGTRTEIETVLMLQHSGADPVAP